MPRAQHSELVQDTLTRAVRIATGIDDALPRPGQDRLTDQVWAAMTDPRRESDNRGGEAVAVAPTGLGKSLSYLVPAALDAALNNKRTVISTESLALQGQILDKDAPVVVEAVKETTGKSVTFAVLKGWSNWVCPRTTLRTAHKILNPGSNSVVAGHELSSGEYISLAAEISGTPISHDAMLKVHGREYSMRKAADLVVWALLQTANRDLGDRHAYEGDVSDGSWSLVSVTPAECIGTKKCPFAQSCHPAFAKKKASFADVVVTNHSMIAVQAAKRISAVIGSQSLGPFDSVVLDEAHALPSNVRNQGAIEISGRRYGNIVASLRSLFDGPDDTAQARSVIAVGEAMGDRIESLLFEAFTVRGRETVQRLGRDESPLMGIIEGTEMWFDDIRVVLSRQKAGEFDNKDTAVMRLRNTMSELTSDLESVSSYRSGVARWVEKTDRRGWEMMLCATPIDVSGPLETWVWSAQEAGSEEGDDDYDRYLASLEEPPLDGEYETYTETPAIEASPVDEMLESQTDVEATKRVAVIALSATLPERFPMQLGLDTETQYYESPFHDAFDRSVLYVPRATPEVTRRINSDWAASAGRYSLDPAKHRIWAGEIAGDLIRANRGSALVLSATAASGRHYAEHLRSALVGTGVVVYSQWDGIPLRQLVALWKSNTRSVLVGTKSLMTGVDAPGKTCSLVIVDRVPRAAGNPVDDARVDELIDRTNMAKHSASRLVYSVDAALLLEQAAGRLIRSTGDSGMVAILDPRILKVKPWAYQDKVRETYLGAVAHFPHKVSSLEAAITRLEASQG